MATQDFTITITVDQSPSNVFNAITNVRGWWSEEINGGTAKLNDEFDYHYSDVHRCKMKLIEVVPDEKVVWKVLDNFFSFTDDKTEWIGTTVTFEIAQKDHKTQLHFTHQGLVPTYECYDACVNGWTMYIQNSLYSLITTGKGQPNSTKTARTTHEVALRFNELAKAEKWFEIQDELFTKTAKSIEPSNSLYLKNAEGIEAIRKKGNDWIKKIEAVHRVHTTEPVVAGKHFAVGRDMDLTVQGYGRIQINEIILYEVFDGLIVSEQFFY